MLHSTFIFLAHLLLGANAGDIESWVWFRLESRPFSTIDMYSSIQTMSSIYVSINARAHYIHYRIWTERISLTQNLVFCSISLIATSLLLGITGRVTFDENGDRVPLFIVDNVQNGKFIAMQHFDPIANSTLRLNGRFLFPGGSAIPPRDVPVCGFDGNFCPKSKLQKSQSMEIFAFHFSPKSHTFCLWNPRSIHLTSLPSPLDLFATRRTKEISSSIKMKLSCMKVWL